MNHDVQDEDEAVVVTVLRRAKRIAEAEFKSNDPLLIMEIHDRLIARVHCCRLNSESEDEEGGARWK